MDTWYATAEMMMLIHKMGKIFYCPIKKNRNVDDEIDINISKEKFKHKSAQSLSWTEEDLQNGKFVNLKGLNLTLKLFQIVLNSKKTELIVTNDLTQNSTDDCQKEVANRWKIEEFHREIKQLTGIEKCQCRKNRIQRNHIACSMLVWVKLKQVANKTKRTVYQVKHELLKDYLVQQLKSPAKELVFA